MKNQCPRNSGYSSWKVAAANHIVFRHVEPDAAVGTVYRDVIGITCCSSNNACSCKRSVLYLGNEDAEKVEVSTTV